MMTKSAFIVGCISCLGLVVGTLFTRIVTTMAGIINVAALKFYLALSLEVVATKIARAVDGVLLGGP